MKRLTIFMAASEAAPFARTGGLGDVACALSQALTARGHDVRLLIPYYGCIDKAAHDITDTGIGVTVGISNRGEYAGLYRSSLKAGTTVYLLRKDNYYDRPELYGTAEGDYLDNAERFCFFSRAVPAVIKRLELEPDIVHCHDWQTGLAAPLVKVAERENPLFRRSGLVFTIHNIAYQGLFWHYDMHLTGLPWSVFTAEGIEFYGKINLLKAGIAYADALTTVSPRYSREIQTPEFGCGLEGAIAGRRDRLTGILNGADYTEWNPATDTHIARNYDRDRLAGKATCKEDLLRSFGLRAPDDRPLLGMVGRFAEQKGFDLVAAALRDLCEAGLSIVILGKGEEKYNRMLRRAVKGLEDRAGLKIAFDDALAHKVYAGADYFLMPSRYEPCGLGQMYGLRYGTVPIVRATGGLDDTVARYDAAAGSGNGFKFEEAGAGALVACVREALAVYGVAPHWDRIRRNAMSCDFSWDRSAAAYEGVYRRARGGRGDRA
ncbi:MAG: glycogen synthase GlgA [bacterium]|nr:glycogen synthase GlgA [bacterium]